MGEGGGIAQVSVFRLREEGSAGGSAARPSPQPALNLAEAIHYSPIAASAHQVEPNQFPQLALDGSDRQAVPPFNLLQV